MTITELPTWTLGDKLRKTRERVHLSQQEMADQLNERGLRKKPISRALVGQWENDTAAPRYQEVEAWASITETPLSWFPESGTETVYGASSLLLDDLSPAFDFTEVPLRTVA